MSVVQKSCQSLMFSSVFFAKSIRAWFTGSYVNLIDIWKIAYDFAGNIPQLWYGSTAWADIPFAVFQTTAPYTGYAIMNPSGAGNIVPNKPLQFRTPVANPTLGNSNVVINLQYRIVEIA